MASRMVIPPTAFAASSRRLKRERVTSSQHLSFIRSLPCLVTGVSHLVQAAHVSFEDLRYGKFGRGKGQKEEDKWAVPLHAAQHMKQHAMNERKFWDDVGIDPCRVALALWNCNGDEETALIILTSNREGIP